MTKSTRKLEPLNERQLKVNAKLAAEQLGELQGAMRKETGKYVKSGIRAMRAEKETVSGNNIPPMSVMLGLKVKGEEGVKRLETENGKETIPEKKVKKTLDISALVVGDI